METFTPLERVDTNRVFAEAEQLLATGDIESFEQFVHALEIRRQQYLDIEKQATATAPDATQPFQRSRSRTANSI